MKFGLEIGLVAEDLLDLRFADDVALFTQQRVDIERMLRHLAECSGEYGLKINFGKTKGLTFKAICFISQIHSAPASQLKNWN